MKCVRSVSILTLIASSAAFAQTGLQEVLKAVEDRYNKPKTMQFLFQQTYSGPGRMTRTEAGELTLSKPGKMRWDYTIPAGKVFLTDGTYAWFYSPTMGRVERTKTKESSDLRAPLAFLMGKLEFNRDFREFRYRVENGEYHVVAKPKSDKAPYDEVEFIVGTDFAIRELAVTGQDKSLMRFRFSSERQNQKFPAGQFEFQAPKGVPVVDVKEGEEEAR
ncbi:MAG: outer membrane lipoprotein chaperone LolA [Acidobacteriota bacterium]